MLGYVEGKTILIKERFADGKPDRMPALAAELVASKVDLIVTPGQGVFAAYRVTTTVPIVAAAADDLVAEGLAESITHPGGNVTGQSIFASQVMAKRLELLKQTVRSLRRAGVLQLRGWPWNGRNLEATAKLAKALDVELEPFEAFDGTSYEAAFSSASAASIGGFVISDAGQFYGDAEIIASIANRHGLSGHCGSRGARRTRGKPARSPPISNGRVTLPATASASGLPVAPGAASAA